MVDADYITKTFTLKKYTVTLNYNNETEETTINLREYYENIIKHFYKFFF